MSRTSEPAGEPVRGSGPSTEPPHLSIGDVLSLLRSEFPEVTISKIRFLESQGLVAPERTPSGYRKFYEGDVERLRWILQQQKDHYLPLKVIREKLDDDFDPAQQAGPVEAVTGAALQPSMDVSIDIVEIRVEHSVEIDQPTATFTRTGAAAALTAPEPTGPRPLSVADDRPARDEPPAEAQDRDAVPGDDPTGHFTRGELARRSGLAEADILDLESHGLLPRALDDAAAGLFDEGALAVAHLARAFARHGIEARHLKMYKHFAEREAALYETVVTPLLKQRNPKARRQAQETVADLARLGRSLRTEMLRAALHGAFDE